MLTLAPYCVLCSAGVHAENADKNQRFPRLELSLGEVMFFF